MTVSHNSAHKADTWPALHWKEVQIVPPSAGARKLPAEASGSHYYAARETDAAFLSVATGKQKEESEKFLFYRGTGDFEAPLNVRMFGDDASHVSLQNKGAEGMRSLFVYEVRADGSVVWSMLNDLKPGETRVAEIAGNSSGTDSLAAALRSALAQEGLYEKEAAAMVKTWEDSWLKERGVRVLYTLARAWTDRTLPLAVTPAPTATVRVMVGRAEIITPPMENALRANLERYLAAPIEQRPAILASTRALGFGRFLSPALERVVTRLDGGDERKRRGWEFIGAVRAAEINRQAAIRVEAGS